MKYNTIFSNEEYGMIKYSLNQFFETFGLKDKIVSQRPNVIDIAFMDLVELLNFKDDTPHLKERFFDAFKYPEHYEQVIFLIHSLIDSYVIGDKYSYFLYIKDLYKQTGISKINEINHNSFNKLLSLKVVIRNVSEPLVKDYRNFYKCNLCDQTEYSIVNDRDFIDSYKKKNLYCKPCGSKSFKLIEDKLVKHSLYRFKFEEPFDSTDSSSSAKTESIYGQIRNELVSYTIKKKINVGDRVILSGKLIPNPVTKSGLSISNYFMEIFTLDLDSDKEIIEFLSEQDEEKILTESVKLDFPEKLMRSIAPKVQGYEECKTALIIQELSGFNENIKVWDNPTISKKYVHILLAGDPSTAKSQLMKFMLKVSPKIYFASGDQSTIAGLMGSAYEDKTFGGGWSLSAGALALANKGTLVIDELNKLDSKETSNLNGVLTDYTINFDKATIHTKIYTEVKLLGVLNPSGNDQWENSSDKQKINQLNMKKAFLSRINLIFQFKETDLSSDEMVRKALDRQSGVFEEQDIYSEDFIKKFFIYAKKKKVEFDYDEVNNQKMNFYKTIYKKRIEEIYNQKEKNEYRKTESPAKMRLLIDNYDAILSGLCRFKITKEKVCKPESWMYGVVNTYLDKYYLDMFLTTESDVFEDSGFSLQRIKINQKDKVKELLNYMKNDLSNNGLFSFVDLMVEWKNIDSTNTEFDLVELLGKLKKVGELIEPKQDYYKLM